MDRAHVSPTVTTEVSSADDAGSQSGIRVRHVAPAPMRTFGDITPALVHDLKGPLSAITMNVDFALDQISQIPSSSEAESVKGALEDCKAAGSRLFRMIANLLDVARCEEGRLRPQRAPVAVGALLSGIVDGYALDAAMRRVDLSLDLDEKVGVLETDADLLGRVVQSIIDNALRHSRPKGHVAVIARVDEVTSHVEIRIANDGAAMPPEVRSRLFHRTLGSESNGAGANRGLGLYFCRLAVEAMGGTIAVADEPGYAVAFAIRFGC